MSEAEDPQDGRDWARIAGDEGYARSRMPSDLLRLLIALVVGAVGFLLASALNNISVGITIEVVDAFEALPAAAVVTFILVVQLLAWILPVVVAALLLLWRRYRRLLLLVLAVGVATASAYGVQTELTSRFRPAELAVLQMRPLVARGNEVEVDLMDSGGSGKVLLSGPALGNG